MLWKSIMGASLVVVAALSGCAADVEEATDTTRESTDNGGANDEVLNRTNETGNRTTPRPTVNLTTQGPVLVTPTTVAWQENAMDGNATSNVTGGANATGEVAESTEEPFDASDYECVLVEVDPSTGARTLYDESEYDEPPESVGQDEPSAMAVEDAAANETVDEVFVSGYDCALVAKEDAGEEEEDEEEPEESVALEDEGEDGGEMTSDSRAARTLEADREADEAENGENYVTREEAEAAEAARAEERETEDETE